MQDRADDANDIYDVSIHTVSTASTTHMPDLIADIAVAESSLPNNGLLKPTQYYAACDVMNHTSSPQQRHSLNRFLA